jgi:exopolyphosphatase/guanosine-5'-triphosphate,3'-diphosphate pyrophosphatase
MRYAVIDVGTNSTRLYVAERTATGVRDIARDLVITRLGQGVDRAGNLHPAAIERTVETIDGYWDRCRAAGVADSHVRVAATSAVRDAADGDVFLKEVRTRTGLDVDVLSGEEEAALSFAGAVADLHGFPGPYCVVDIGGGSTELVVGDRTVEAAISLDIGSVRLTERCIRDDPPSDGQVREVAAVADEALAGAEQRVHPELAQTLVGVAGTITTLAAVALDLPGYDRDRIHHASLSMRTIDDLVGKLSSMTSAERLDLPAMPAGREDVIVAGTVILQRVMNRFGFGSVLVSECDILDGLMATLL